LKPSAANCSDCVDEYYKDPFRNWRDRCVLCDEDRATCENGTTLFTIDVKHGYYRFQNKSKAIYECPLPENCLGGPSAGTASCRTGAFGPLCELCKDEYYFEGDSNTCESCADATKGSNVVTLFIIAGVMGVLAIVTGGLMMHNADRLDAFYAQNEERILQLSAKITALIITMQIIVLVNKNHRDLEGAMLPQPYGKFLDSLSFLALDMVEFVPFSCLFGRVGHLQRLLVWTVGPLSLIALVSILILVSKHERRKILRENTCFGVMLVLPLISRVVLQTFRCVEYDKGDSYVGTKTLLFVDPEVDCTEASYESMRVYATLMTVIWPVGVPIALVIWLSRLSPYLDPPNVSEEEAIELRKKDPSVVGSSIAFVALLHRPRYWYYEVVFNLQRRLILTCVVLVFENNGTFICFVLGVCIMTTVSEREMNPHLDPFVGAFVYLMQWQILLCILAMLLMDAQMTNAVGDMAIGLILMLVNIFMALVVFLDTRGDIVREAQEKAAMRAKMVRTSVFGGNFRARVAKRFTARVSLASSMFQKKWEEEEEEEDDDDDDALQQTYDDDDEDDAEIVAVMEVVGEDDLCPSHDTLMSSEDGIGHMTNPMYRAWSEAKGGDSAADKEAFPDNTSSIEMTTTKIRGVSEAERDHDSSAAENTGDSSESEEIDVAPEDVKVSAVNAEDSSESEEIDVAPEDAELSADGTAAATTAVAGVSSDTGSLSDLIEAEAICSMDEGPIPVPVVIESNAEDTEGSVKEESIRHDGADGGERVFESGEGEGSTKTEDQMKRAERLSSLKDEFFDSL
jgi:hypothetical protein